jgi:hypothetical protein
MECRAGRITIKRVLQNQLRHSKFVMPRESGASGNRRRLLDYPLSRVMTALPGHAGIGARRGPVMGSSAQSAAPMNQERDRSDRRVLPVLQARRGPDLVLDRVLMQNAATAVDQAYRRLCLPAPDVTVE